MRQKESRVLRARQRYERIGGQSCTRAGALGRRRSEDQNARVSISDSDGTDGCWDGVRRAYRGTHRRGSVRGASLRILDHAAGISLLDPVQLHQRGFHIDLNPPRISDKSTGRIERGGRRFRLAIKEGRMGLQGRIPTDRELADLEHVEFTLSVGRRQAHAE